MIDIDALTTALTQRVQESENPSEVLRAPELRELYGQIKTVAPEERAAFGQRINDVKRAVEEAVKVRQDELDKVELAPIDVTAPFDVNATKPALLPSEQGTIHPLMREMEVI